jgi:hypothetical protein
MSTENSGDDDDDTTTTTTTTTIKMKKMIFLTALKMVDIDCTVVSQILTAGVPTPIKLWRDAPMHPCYNSNQSFYS